MKTKEIKKKINKASRVYTILLAILLIVAPIIAYWHIEITTQFTPNLILTNGFGEFQPIKVYHFHMWLVFIVNLGAAFYLLIKNE
jgi:lipoprotein signal peptidase